MTKLKVDTWSVTAWRKQRPWIWTCYGLDSRSAAEAAAKEIWDSGLVFKIEITHAMKGMELRARWKTEKTFWQPTIEQLTP